MCLDFNAVDYFILPLELVVVVFLEVIISTLIVTFLIRFDCVMSELKLSTIELYVDKLINELADYLTISRPQSFQLDILDVWKAKLLKICYHLVQCFFRLTLEVFVVNEYS